MYVWILFLMEPSLLRPQKRVNVFVNLNVSLNARKLFIISSVQQIWESHIVKAVK